MLHGAHYARRTAKHMRTDRRTAARRSRQAPPLLTFDGTPESSSKDAPADAVDSPKLSRTIAQLDVEAAAAPNAANEDLRLA